MPRGGAGCTAVGQTFLAAVISSLTWEFLSPDQPRRVWVDNRRKVVYGITPVLAGVVKLVDAPDSKSGEPCARGSSILPSGTNNSKRR